MGNIVSNFFECVSTSKKIPQAFLIGNVDFESFEKELKIILEKYFFKNSIDLYNNPDIIILRQNESLITKNNIKDLLLNLSITSQFNDIKVYIIEDCEKLTENVYNALLKTLEEPERGIYAFLLTSNITAVKPTIASRCQKFFISSNVKIKPREEYYNFSKEIVQNIEKNGINIIANNCEIYNQIKDKAEFTNILINILDIYKKILLKVINNKINDEDVNIVSKNDIKKILEKILIINDNINRSKKNLNKNLCIDRFLIDMWRCK